MKKLVSVFFAIFLFGCSSRTATPEPVSRVVTEIQIVRQSDQLTHRYTSQKAMNRILSYLRRLDPYGKSDAKPENNSEGYQIRLIYSDGSEKSYAQVGLQYFCDADGQWMQINPKAASELPLLFYALADDQSDKHAAISA